MSSKIITIRTNESDFSLETKKQLAEILQARGYTTTDEYTPQTELVVCIGGDGCLLKAVHICDFPDCPFVGINTGHLGFFQEVHPEDMEVFVDDYSCGNYTIQHMHTVNAAVTTVDKRVHHHIGLNEVVVKGKYSNSIHLDISIDGKPIEKFSGDGIVVATSAGSTAYNYSLGGSIVDPRIRLLQVTPIAPMNTTAHRSFTSSVLLPAELSLGVVPENTKNDILVVNDGIENNYTNIKNIEITISDKIVNLIRFSDYDFWNKVKNKFL